MRTVLFDLDGTLLPMDAKVFETAYFKRLSACIRDIPEKVLMEAILAGTGAMYLNDGSRTNREVFAEVFSRSSHLDYYENEPRFMEFYLGDFQKCAGSCDINGFARAIVTELESKGYRLALATNPIFPEVGTYSRLSWLNLDPREFALVSTFENSRFCKPNMNYYREVLEKLDETPENCIMIGNDVEEDGVVAALGMPVMIVTDYMINYKNMPTEPYMLTTLEGVLDWARALPQCEG